MNHCSPRVATLVLVSVLLTACGSDDSRATSTTTGITTTTAMGNNQQVATDVTTSVAPVTEAISGLEATLANAGTDLCKLDDFSLNGFATVASPSTKEEGQESVELIVAFLQQAAKAIRSTDAETSKELSTAATELLEEAQEIAYEPTKIASLESVSGNEFATTIAQFHKLAAQKCAQS